MTVAVVVALVVLFSWAVGPTPEMVIRAYQRRGGVFRHIPQRFQPPPCYVCDHPGPMGELVASLPCCVVCREAVTRELDAILDPFKEAREREEHRLAPAEARDRTDERQAMARAVTAYAVRFQRMPASLPMCGQELAMRLGVPVEVLGGQSAAAAEYLRAKHERATQDVLSMIALPPAPERRPWEILGIPQIPLGLALANLWRPDCMPRVEPGPGEKT